MDVEARSSNWSLIYIIPDSTSDYLSTLQSTLHEIFAVHDQNEDSMVIEGLMFVNPQYRSIGIKFGDVWLRLDLYIGDINDISEY